MFFKPQTYEKGENKVRLSAAASLIGFSGYAKEIAEKWIADFGEGNEPFVVTATRGDALPAEGCEIVLSENEIDVRYSDERGLIYAVLTLLQLSENDELFVGRLADSPDCSFRGYRVYLPGRKSFGEFRAMVDFIAYYKYNYVSLEVGGAMEYKRHPEINARWAEFAADTHRYSDRAHEIQNGFDWAKNSIHTDNGEGDVLTQDEVRELIAYCRSRGLEVYPEVPSLSHTDYICMAHPEIAERKDDPYADTYCPSNPRSYELLFDVLDEVIEVFEPKIVNIGHDEFYSMCVCEKCRDRRPQDVFAEDVIKIHDYLAARGIKTAMWCDKLLPVVTKSGFCHGGAGTDHVRREGVPAHVSFPPTFQCQSMLPRDILMIHWYYGFGMQHDLVMHTHGYPTVFGNMSVAGVERWRLRRELGIRGGSCSNWGSNNPEYMQRNNQYLNLVMGAYAMWSRDYDTAELENLTARAFDECYRKHFGALRGHIEVVHTTEKYIPYKVFYDGVFIEDEIYHMGKYRLTYTDGTTAEFEVKYGTNIGSARLMNVTEGEKDPTLGVAEGTLGELSYSTIPSFVDGKTVYRTAYRNPHPEKAVRSFEYIPENGEVELVSVTFHR